MLVLSYGKPKNTLAERIKAAIAKFWKNRDTPTSTDSIPADKESANTQQPIVGDRRSDVAEFIERVFEATGRTITKTHIWRVAGYTDATQFERFQRNQKASLGSAAKFTRILKLNPEDFLKRLDSLDRR